MTPIQYKGYTIEEEADPWAIKYGWNYRFFCDEVLHGAKTIEEAKMEIDELTEEETV